MKKTTSKTKGGKHREEAEKLAGLYRLLISSHGAKGFVGASVEMPLVLGRGMTETQCIADTREAIVTTIEYMLDKGETPPSPASEGKREVQLNIRLTADERMRIHERARQAGFRSIADFMRRAALRAVI
jgi:predicted RNase H-like HicB family nuclease